MKYLILITVILFLSVNSRGQGGEWTWVSGDSIPIDPGNYGIKGVPSPQNKPGARYGPVSWTGSDGSFWIYGGWHPPTPFNLMADLWNYNPLTNEWTWMHGDTGVWKTEYGVKGVASPLNTPGYRRYCSGAWVDADGNLWLFGGQGYDESGRSGWMNDLWKFDNAINQWTWMHGDSSIYQFGSYGTKGVPAPGNKPGARWETCASWTDDAGKFWLFGGDNYDLPQSPGGLLNDLWKYDPLTNEWTWVHGDSTINQASVFGQKGISSPANKPTGRWIHAKWKDTDGNFWIFGGLYIIQGIANDQLNDLWKYNPATNEWTWMSGDSILNPAGRFGSYCLPDKSNRPPGRNETRATWVDSCNNLWLLGGAAIDTTNRYGWGLYNDLWKYSIADDEWTFVHGDSLVNQPTVFGTKGIADKLNKPGARAGAVSWNYAGNFWFFAGSEWHVTSPAGANYTFWNDLWKYSSPEPIADFIAPTVTGCAPLTVDFLNQSDPNCTKIKSYLWNFGDGRTDTAQNPSVTFNQPGIYDISLVVYANCGMDEIFKDGYVIVEDCDTLPCPPMVLTFSITAASPGQNNGGVKVIVSGGEPPFLFSLDSVTFQSSSSFTGLDTGTYQVFVIDSNDCTESGTFTINPAFGVGIQDLSALKVKIYTSPAMNYIIIEGLERESTLQLYDVVGKKLLSADLATGTNRIKINNLASGVYFYRINALTGKVLIK